MNVRALTWPLLIVGVCLAAFWNRGVDGRSLMWTLLPLVAAVPLLFRDTRRLLAKAHRFNRLGPHARGLMAMAVGITSFIFFFVTAMAYDRALFPIWHDEQMHAVQARLLSTGRLWTASHPMGDFFETFHILNEPVYAPMHFPGTAILNVPGVWLGLPAGVIPLLLISCGCALTYVVAAKLVGDLGGLLAAAMVWASPDARMLATMLISHNATLCLAPLVMWLYLRWRDVRSVAAAVGLGAALGLFGITRPVESIAVGLPIGIAVLLDVWPAGVRGAARAMVPMAVATMPFLTVQLVFDKGVTGRWMMPPYQYYNNIAFPLTSFASARPDPNVNPPHVSDLPQRQAYYEQFMLGNSLVFVNTPLVRLVLDRVDFLSRATLPGVLMLVFVPLGLISAVRSRAAFVVAAPAALMFLLYFSSIFYDGHYAVMSVTSMAGLTVLGMAAAARGMTAGRRAFRSGVGLGGVIAVVVAIPPLSVQHVKEFTTKPYLMGNFVHRELRKHIRMPALVFFTYTPGDNYHDEPVYNTASVNPDDADVVLAQSLGNRNYELVRYYDRLGQNRNVYEVDRRAGRLITIGTVAEIDRRHAAALRAATTRPTSTRMSP